MSDPVFNFGLKLYNFQNLDALTRLLGETQHPQNLNGLRSLDPSYEHTEYELLRKLFGDLTLSKMLTKVTEERISDRIEQNLLQIEAQTAKTIEIRSPQKISEKFSFSKETQQTYKKAQIQLEASRIVEAKNKESFIKKLQDGFKAMINRSTLS